MDRKVENSGASLRGAEALLMHLGMDEIARRILEVRKRRSLSQADLARQIGVSQGTVSKWEKGTQKPEPDAAARLAEFTGDNIDFFLFKGKTYPIYNQNRTITVPVKYRAKTGLWLEDPIISAEEMFMVAFPKFNDWDDSHLFACISEDEYIDEFYPEGSVVLFRPITAKNHVIGNGDPVLVKRDRSDGFSEISIRVYSNYNNVSIGLMAKSHRPSPGASYSLLPRRNEDGVSGITVIGVALASFRVEPARTATPAQWRY